MSQNNPVRFLRKSVAQFNVPSHKDQKKEPWNSLYGRMFIEDVQNHIMPIGGRSRAKPNFSIGFEPQDPDLLKIIKLCFTQNYRSHGSRNLTEAICDFVADVAVALAYKGTVHYEITKINRQESLESATQSSINTAVASIQAFQPQIVPGVVFHLGRYYFQIIPRSEWERVKERLVVIPAADIWKLRVPLALGGSRVHKRLLKSLSLASNSLPDFVPDAMRDQSGFQAFNFQEFHRRQLLTVARESSEWGWGARRLWRDESLQYFRVYRDLRFARAMAILREYTIQCMNELLERQGFRLTIKVNGLPTKNEVDHQIKQLEVGAINFEDARKFIEL